jgi:hypothetical protein
VRETLATLRKIQSEPWFSGAFRLHVRFRRQSGRAKAEQLWQLMTQSGHSGSPKPAAKDNRRKHSDELRGYEGHNARRCDASERIR